MNMERLSLDKVSLDKVGLDKAVSAVNGYLEAYETDEVVIQVVVDKTGLTARQAKALLDLMGAKPWGIRSEDSVWLHEADEIWFFPVEQSENNRLLISAV